MAKKNRALSREPTNLVDSSRNGGRTVAVLSSRIEHETRRVEGWAAFSIGGTGARVDGGFVVLRPSDGVEKPRGRGGS